MDEHLNSGQKYLFLKSIFFSYKIEIINLKFTNQNYIHFILFNEFNCNRISISEALLDKDFDFVVERTLLVFTFEKHLLFLFPILHILINFFTTSYPLMNGLFTTIAKYFYKKICLSLII